MSLGFDNCLTVIVATLASAERSMSLQRAVQSIRSQDVRSRIIVVVNGNRRDDEIMEWLLSVPDLNVLDQAEGNFAKALAFGVRAVKTPFYSFLDDDDELLPHACRRRAEFMAANSHVDLLVTPGRKKTLSGHDLVVPEYRTLDHSDLIGSLIGSNWLASCGGVFRKSTICDAQFCAVPNYLEWTFLALQIARNHNVHIMHEDEPPHFVVHETNVSESNSVAYHLAMPANVALLKDASHSPHWVKQVSKRLAEVCHAASDCALKNGMLAEAWKNHLKSLGYWSGIKYLPFTRHLILESLRSRN